MRQKYNLLISLAFIFLINISYSQTKKILRDLLWESIDPCYSEITVDYEKTVEEIKDEGAEIIDDSRNGYLEVSGTFPTCGCPCKSVSGAYRQIDGNYTIFTKEEWGCSWNKKTTSNRELNAVLPKGFGLSSFIPNYKSGKYNKKYAVFYLDVEIPRIGTDTKVSLSLIPNGIYSESESALTYEYRENSNTEYIYGLAKIAKNIKSSNTLDLILTKQYDKIPKLDMNLIKNVINKNRKSGTSLIQSIDDLNEQLINVYEIFSLYKLIEYDAFILGWDKSNSRFYIKERILKKNGTVSFKEFIIKFKGWAAVC